MKKSVILIVFVLCFFIVNSQENVPITGEVITGKATEQSIGMSIEVVSLFPQLVLYSPQNETYLKETILLNFSAQNYDSIWYNIDDGSNITVTGSTYFSTTPGTHTLNLFNNDTQGDLNFSSVIFNVNLSGLSIIYSDYNSSNYNTSALLNYSVEDLQNFSDFYIENDYGGLLLIQPINLTNDSNPNDNIININNHILIGTNYIYINSTALPNLNKPAILTLRNLNFDNPQVLRDGEVCSNDVCKISDYSSGTLTFNVTGFSNYSVREYVDESDEEDPGNGQGGGTRRAREVFSLTNSSIKINLYSSTKSNESIIQIKNLLSDNSRVSLLIDSKLRDIITTTPSYFELQPNIVRDLKITASPDSLIEPGIHSGYITLSSGDDRKKIFVIVEYSPSDPTLSASLNLSDKKMFFAGETVYFNLNLKPLNQINGPVKINYVLRDDSNNKEHDLGSEELNIDSEIVLQRDIDLPSKLSPGNYVFFIEINFDDDKKIFLSSLIEVHETSYPSPSAQLDKLNYFVFAFILLLIALFVILISRKISSSKKSKINQ